MLKHVIIFCVFLILGTNIIFSQTVNEQRYKLAESFELNGDLQGALRIYKELMKEDPKNDDFFEGYVRTMKSLNNFSELLKDVRDRLNAKEGLAMLDLYAELNWRTGNTEEANKTWEKALSKFSEFQNTYMLISQTQINLRLFDKAITTLIKGRDEFKDKRLFTDPLIKLYIAVGDYKNGTLEIINLLDSDFNLPQAQGRLFALMINEDAKIFIGEELKRISDNNHKNIVYQEAYSWFLKTTGKSAEALELVVRIDEMKNTNGLEILNFATTASRDGDYETAAKAYQLIIDKGKSNPYSSSALFGLTRSLEQKILSVKGKYDKKAVNEVINSYKKIIDDYPKTANSADSRLRLAKIYSDIFKDYEQAVEELEKLLKEFGNSQYGVSAYLEMGNIYLIKDDLDKADVNFTKVKDLSRFANTEQKDKAMYNSALTTYYRGNITKAKEAFTVLALNPDADIANDVLQKLSLINSNEEKVAALELFAKAELKENQGKSKEAVELYSEVGKLAAKSTLEEASLFKSAEIEFNEGKYASCREYLSQLNSKYPDSKNNDKRIMLTAESFYSENNTAEALKYYTELITKYPDSIYLHEARTKIRIIRKDNI